MFWYIDDWYDQIYVITSFLELAVTMALAVVAVAFVRRRSPIAMMLLLLASMLNAIALVLSPIIYFDYWLSDPLYDIVMIVLDYWELFSPIVRGTAIALIGVAFLLVLRARPPQEEDVF